mgnify:CR=1 FL=1
MKVFLTGANGFLGKQVLSELVSRGHEVVLFSRRRPAEQWSALKWIQGDCNNLSDCVAAMKGSGFDAVLHVAALPAPTDIPGTPEFDDLLKAPQTMQTNVMGLYNMLSAALRAEIGVFVQTGSNCVIGHERRISGLPPEWRYLPIDEAHPGDPQDSYSVSKACGELLLKAFSAYGMHTCALRCGWILDKERRIMVATKRAAVPTADIRRVFNSYVAIEDCARAHVMALEAELTGDLLPYETLFVHADDTLAPEPTMELLEKFRPDLIPLLRRPLPGYASFFSNDRIKAATGWRSTISWRDEQNG